MKTIDVSAEVGSARIAIVASRYNNFVVDRLLHGAVRTLEENGIDGNSITLVRVPGAYEIPLATKALADEKQYDGIITLGAVIRGETPHFDYICSECTRGINEISLAYKIPVAFGVLTVDTTEQAMDRSGEEESNKGRESALTVLEMINVLAQISGG